VANYRTTRAEALTRAAGLLGVQLPASVATDTRSYALTHHYVYAVTDAVQAGQVDDARALADEWPRAYHRPGVEILPGHRVSIAERDACRERDDANYESPLYLCLGDAELSTSDSEVWAEALAAVAASGLDWIVESVLGVVVALDDRNRRETTNSYTLKALPGSIFIDLVADPVRLGELVLHESAHALLNDVLNAFDVRLSPEARWYSPWKGVNRPAYGILHAGFAFGVLQSYFQYFGQDAPEISPYAKIRAETGAEQWDAARASVADALQEVAAEPVSELLRRFLG
jgi:HEXXH motif-containing protein